MNIKYNIEEKNLIDLNPLIEIIVDYIRNDCLLMFCGNGGNSADSEHIVGELVKSFKTKRKLSHEDFELINDVDIASKLEYGIKAISLTSNSALNFAIINDIGSEFVFAQQVYTYGSKNDILFCLSTSGNSKNVLNAAKVAKAQGILVICLTGENNSKLVQLSDHVIQINEKLTYKIQEAMIIIYHYLCLRLEENLYFA